MPRVTRMFVFSLKYTLVCLLVVAFLLFCNRLFKHNKKRGALVSLIALGVVSAISCNFSSDGEVYYVLYNEVLSYFSSLKAVITFRYQNAFQVLCYLVQKYIGGAYTIFFVTTAMFVLMLWMIFRKHSANPRYSVMIWLLAGFFAVSCNILKQYMAMLIMSFAYFALQKRRYLLFCGLTFLASLFHVSALIIGIIFVVVRNARFSARKLAYSVGAACMLAVFIVPCIELIVKIPVFAKYAIYLAIFQKVQLRLMLGPFINLAFYLLVIALFHGSRDKMPEYMNKYLTLIMIGICFSIIGMRFVYVARLSYYFYQFVPLLLADGIEGKIITGNRKICLGIALVVFCFLFTIFSGELSYFNYSTIYNDYPVPLRIFMSR